MTEPTLCGAEPQLFVSDIAASCEFYTKQLGFAVAFSYGEPPFYAQVFRDAARLNLRQLDTPDVDPALRDREELLSASIPLDDAEPLFIEYQAAGVAFAQALKTEPWGARTFIVRDPDSNLILFAGRVRTTKPSLTSIGQLVPELPVTDIERAQQHYRDALGFEIGWLHPDGIGAVSRGNVAIFLRKTAPPFAAAVHWVFADDIDATYNELRSLGAKIVEPLELKPWGLRQFTVEDLDGHRFHFHHD